MKRATLYAYVSRGLIANRRSADGRTSLFDADDVVRLAKRARGRHGAPSDVTVASELTLLDGAAGGVWYRGVDVLRACRELRFEEIAWWLWTGSFERMNTWRSEPRTLAAAEHAQTALPRSTPPPERLPLVASAVAAAHGRRMPGTRAASDVMATLLEALPGPKPGAAQFAIALASKLGTGSMPRALVKILDASLSLTCEQGLTSAALVARLTTSAGGGVAAAVSSAMTAALPQARAIEHLVTGIDTGSLDTMATDIAFSTDVFRAGDPRARVLLDMLGDAAPKQASTIEAFCRSYDEPPTVSFALAAVAWACGIAAPAAPAIPLVAQSVGWIAHALEEERKPTPYRPRLAYTGPAPVVGTPRRTIDAVRDYLARE